jgi:cell wall assembly regulator SMI1
MDITLIRSEVSQLVRAAARVPGTTFAGGASDAEIDDLQQVIGSRLPRDLTEWLRVCKGDAIGPGGVFGVRHNLRASDIASVLDRFPVWRDRAWLPVAGDGNGDYYVLLTEGELAGHIAFVDQSDFEALGYVVASNLWTFVRSLLLADAGDRRWPFNRDHVLALDPAMANIPAHLQPWGTGP